MKYTKHKIFSFTILIISLAFFFNAQAWARGHFFIIGTGPAGPELATLQALKTIKRMDVIIADKRHIKLFSEYIEDKPILFDDPWKGVFTYKGKSYKELSSKEMVKFDLERSRIRNERVKKIKQLLNQGKDVGLFIGGNPCVYGPGHWYAEQFDPEDVVVIPGMGCASAALAAVKKSSIAAYDVRYLIQTAPVALMTKGKIDQGVLRDMVRYPCSMIFYMALWDAKELFSALREVLPSNTPCAVVYWAGYSNLQHILCGTVADMGEKISKQKEKFMGLVLVGKFLKGKPFTAALNRTIENAAKR
ncbi:MAG: hypothetical protein J7L78_03530 [Dehalococcoidales bacterium]|nr:hypothetical protein [Dehalococcoidales bacterium]